MIILDMHWDMLRMVGEAVIKTPRQTARDVFGRTLSQDVTTKYEDVITKSISKVPPTVCLLPVSKAIHLRGFTVPRSIRFILGERRKPTKEPTDLFGDCICRVRESLTGQRLGRDKVIGWIRGIRYELSLCIGGQ